MQNGDRLEWVWNDSGKENLIIVRKTGHDIDDSQYGSSSDADDDSDDDVIYRREDDKN